jgi:fermentation-respiration switch protein FrsA (DUF1100 family)
VDGLANLPRLGLGHALRLTAAGLRDQAGALLGRPPHMLPSVGPVGSTAVMTSPDAEPGFRALNPDGPAWPNEAAARIALRIGAYRPTRHVARVLCPILFVVTDDDVITPGDLAAKAAGRAQRGELRRYAGGHFDVYVEPLFERVVTDEVAFLGTHLS